MKRNFLLLLAFLVGIILVVNSTKRLLNFRLTASKVTEEEVRLKKLQEENEALQRDLEYKRSQEFTEGEIRNKLGLVKEGETVIILPKEQDRDQLPETSRVKKPNWWKWWDLFFGG